MKNNLRISNMVFTGKLPFNEHKINDVECKRLIDNADFNLIKEEMGRILSKTVNIRKKPKLSVHHREKQPYVSVWMSGSINIVGVLNRKEANQVYNIVLNDFKKYCKRVLR